MNPPGSLHDRPTPYLSEITPPKLSRTLCCRPTGYSNSGTWMQDRPLAIMSVWLIITHTRSGSGSEGQSQWTGAEFGFGGSWAKDGP
jgi:hypothetical protein